MSFRDRGLLAGLAALALAALPSVARAQANPAMPFYGYGAIVANPAYPIAGENAVITVDVTNTGDQPATNVQVKLSFNDWGVTFMGWQEIGTETIASLPAGATATATFNHVFETRTHTCLEALIVGASENSDPNDDRGQINLEVINAGETFSYGVPVVNNGDEPLDLLVLGHARGDAGVPGGPDRFPVIEKVVHLEPGEELIIPVELDLRGLPPGTPVEFQIDAFNLADPGNVHQREHVLLRVVKTSAQANKIFALNSLTAIAGGLPKGPVANRFRNALKHLERALNPRLWVDANHIVRNGGAAVFAEEGFFDLAVTPLLPELPAGIRAQVADTLRSLVDCDRILADTARGEAAALLLPAVQKLMARADAAREAGHYAAAIHLYKLAWLVATR
ncbi:MAG: hypothetical protein FJX72_02360 [Armatimonadetes bacterium]|nr:hypothetical protein [Armatimonadota bacterium]